MFWNITWIVAGIVAFLLAIINLIRSMMKKRSGWQALMFASLSSGVVAVLAWMQMISHWVKIEDVSAIYDVVPALAKVLSVAVVVGIVLNLVVLVKNRDAKA